MNNTYIIYGENVYYLDKNNHIFSVEHFHGNNIRDGFNQNMNFVKPILSLENNTFIEGATPEEIAELNKPIVPQTARSMNFRLVLIQNGISMQSVYDLIDSLPTPQNQLAYQMFEYATHYDRNNAMVNGLAQMMGISQDQLDDFFIQSENLVV